MYGQFFVLFALMFSGFFLRKLKLIDEGLNRGLNSFMMNFGFPCLLLYKVGTMEIFEVAKDFSFMLVMSVAALFLYTLIGHIYVDKRHYPDKQKVVAEMCMTASNNGFMGFPMALLFFGERGLLLMLAHNTAMNIYTFTYGVLSLRWSDIKAEKGGKGSGKEIVKMCVKAVFNPGILAVILGAVVAALGIPLENAVGDYLNSVGSVCTPMSMIYIGSTLATGNLQASFRNPKAWESTILKLFVMPIITCAICMVLPIDPAMKNILILGAALPSATIATMMADLYGHDRDLGSQILFITTLLSMATIPLFIWVSGVI